MRCPALVDVNVLCFWTQCTVDSLSQKIPVCFNVSGTVAIFSSTSHDRRTLASSKSFMDS